MGLLVSDGFLMGRPPMGARGTGPQGRGDRAVVLACHHSGSILEEWLRLVAFRSRSKHLADHSR